MCANGYKNYLKSRPAASRDSVKRAKTIELDKIRTHPLFESICDSETENLEFVRKMKNYKPQIVSCEIRVNTIFDRTSRIIILCFFSRQFLNWVSLRILSSRYRRSGFAN